MAKSSTSFASGNTVASDAHRWRMAVNRAVSRKVSASSKRIKLDALADTLVDAGIAGDIAAIREVGNRLDGQAVAVGAGVSGLTIVIQQGLADQSRDAIVIDAQPIDSTDKLLSEGD